jgi:hypothetical protein
MSWYIRFLLFFKRPQYSFDTETLALFATKITYKRLFGAAYVLKREIVILPPQHYNCRCVLEPARGDVDGSI